MKRKRLWKPGGHPRRAAGSMRLNRKKAQQTTPKGSVPTRKEATQLDTAS